MPHPRTIVVTGANRGIGRAICESLLSHPALSSQPLKLFATTRTGANLPFQPLHSAHHVHYPTLDVSSAASIHALHETIQTAGISGELILINNAGVNLDRSPDGLLAAARQTLTVNYHGPRILSQTFLPSLRATRGRIVNLSSVASALKTYPAALRTRLLSATSLSDLDTLIEEYLSALVPGSTTTTTTTNTNGTDQSSSSSSSSSSSTLGTPLPRPYAFSKALLRRATTLLAAANPDLLINACCPGWIATEMGNAIASTGRAAPKSAADGARIPVRLAVEELGGVSGGYWANESVRGKGEGRVWEEWV